MLSATTDFIKSLLQPRFKSSLFLNIYSRTGPINETAMNASSINESLDEMNESLDESMNEAAMNVSLMNTSLDESNNEAVMNEAAMNEAMNDLMNDPMISVNKYQ